MSLFDKNITGNTYKKAKGFAEWQRTSIESFEIRRGGGIVGITLSFQGDYYRIDDFANETVFEEMIPYRELINKILDVMSLNDDVEILCTHTNWGEHYLYDIRPVEKKPTQDYDD